MALAAVAVGTSALGAPGAGAQEAPDQLPWAPGSVVTGDAPATSGPRLSRTSSTFGQVTHYAGPADEVDFPVGLVSGPDGNVWFADPVTDRLARVTLAGDVTTFAHPDVVDPFFLAAGEDGAVWFTSAGNDRIGRITTDGAITTFTSAGLGDVYSLAPGPEGDLWFTHETGIARITTDGVFSGVDAETGCNAHPWVTAGPDGRMWTSCIGRDALVRLSADGHDATVIDDDGVGPEGGGTHVLVTGPDGRIWFTDGPGDAVGSMDPGPRFSDVAFAHTFYDDIEWAASTGVAIGNADGTFGAAADVRRAPMAAFLYRLAGEPVFTAPSTPTFTDVPASHQFFLEIEWLHAEGIANGRADGTFGASATVSRQAMAAFLYRASGEPAFTAPGTPTFTDVPTGHHFFAEIEWMHAAGIATGHTDGTFRPAQPVTRAAMAAFLHRMASMPV